MSLGSEGIDPGTRDRGVVSPDARERVKGERGRDRGERMGSQRIKGQRGRITRKQSMEGRVQWNQ